MGQKTHFLFHISLSYRRFHIYKGAHARKIVKQSNKPNASELR